MPRSSRCRRDIARFVRARLSQIVGIWLALQTAATAGTITGKIAFVLPDKSNTVVYIEKIPGKTFPPPSEPKILDQINLTFTPHVVVILAGTKVAFPNSD